ncbi:MAG: hypothetical protein LBR22_10190 [Desulfovibrio sp.]|jgi:hypothetical protein|nr:hypothetical protein [Desulfovibrio sp.]
MTEGEARKAFADDQTFVLEMAQEWYGGYEAWALNEKSHHDFPVQEWDGRVIPVEDIRAAFIDNFWVSHFNEANARVMKEMEENPPEDDPRRYTWEEVCAAVGL